MTAPAKHTSVSLAGEAAERYLMNDEGPTSLSQAMADLRALIAENERNKSERDDLLAALKLVLVPYEMAMRHAGQTAAGFEASQDVIAARAAIAKATEGSKP